jgi:site-specific DNA-methyltransferase (adenine-specific)
LSQNDKPAGPRHDTRAEIAKAANTSTGMVGMAEVVRKEAPKLWEKAKREEITVSAAYKDVKKKQRREEIEQRKIKTQRAASTAPKKFRLIHGCLTELLDQPGGFADYVVTDPPYPKQYLPLYDDLARVSRHVLKDGGSLLCMTGQTYLPQVIKSLCAGLDYHWVLAYLTPGGQAVQQFPRKVNAFWKPVIWMTKGEYKGEWVGDATKSNINDNDKRHHHWGQSESGMLDLMARFVMPGQVVVDPFMGAGTTGIVAVELGAEFVGVDIDENSYLTAEDRLNATIQ